MGKRLAVRARRITHPDWADRGAAVAEFVMMAMLLVFLLFAVLQVALYFYICNIVAASAADGARYAANAGVDVRAGGPRATSLIRTGLTAGVADDVPCLGSAHPDADTGLRLAVVHCDGTVNSIFLPIGKFLPIRVTSRVLKEGVP